ncbi:MAG: DNA polymerase III subunit gamma/tau [Planctomycetia bacterium]|nr:DNA polymerase III subunit gamma/tau [Planctomycetia bacterium]
MAKRKSATPETPEAAALLPAGTGDQASPSVEQPAPSSAANYTVLARRYRPQQFTDVVGQEPVAQALVNALQSNRVAHAYLFTGARGVGKTSTARILAKALNCVRGPTPTPCGECDSCRAIATGEDTDVAEIDGASNRTIDDVREIRQNVQYRPSRSRYKIYIIDEVHMLTKEAFNALLKTLEEPPEHVKFIFATTDVHKVPITILSRCQRFDFVGINGGRIVERLREIVAQEGMAADDDALELVARRGAGSMRDAQSLLDQLLAFGGERLTVEQVHRLLGTAPADRVLALAEAALGHDPKRAIELLDDAAEAGLQLGELLDQLIDYWRDLMAAHCAGAEARNLSVVSRYRDTLIQQAKAAKLDTILAGLDVLAAAKNRLRGSTQQLIWLQASVFRLARLDDLLSVGQLVQLLGTGGTSATPVGERAASERKPAAPTSPAPVPMPRAEQRTSPAVAPLSLAPRPPTVEPRSAPAGTGPAGQAKLTVDNLEVVWPQIVAGFPLSFRTALERATPAISGPNQLVIRFPSAYNIEHKHFLELGGIDRLESLLAKAAQQKWTVKAELTDAPAGERPAATPPPAINNSSASRQQREDQALQDALVRRVKEVFRANFESVDEGFGVAPGDPARAAEGTDTEEA